MRIDIEYLSQGRLSVLRLSHKEENMIWNVEAYSRSTFQDVMQLFDNINGYFASLKKEEQDTVWDIYKASLTAMDEINEPTRLHQFLQNQMKTLFEIVTFESVRKWVLGYGKIALPDDLKNDYGPEDTTQLIRQRTYLRDDYYALAVFSIQLKVLVPIFGEYIGRVNKETGTKFKESYTMNLLSKTEIVRLDVFNRLLVYIDASIESEKIKNPSVVKNSAILNGLGSSELPMWLLARIIVRRIAVSEVNMGENLISNVYHTVTQQLSQLDKTFNGRVVDKIKPRTAGSDENKTSLAENYKINQEISDGDLVMLSVYADDVENMVKRVDPTVDKDKIQLAIQIARASGEIPISKHQITMAQWVLSKAIPPRGIPLLNKRSLLNAIAATQAILWNWELHELALLMFVMPAGSPGYGANVTATRLSRKYVDMFLEEYPHYQRITAKDDNLRQTNVACKAIDNIALSLIQNEWKYWAPAEICEKLSLPLNDTRPYIVSAEIKHQLAELIVRINSNRHSAI